VKLSKIKRDLNNFWIKSLTKLREKLAYRIKKLTELGWPTLTPQRLSAPNFAPQNIKNGHGVAKVVVLKVTE